MVAAAARLVTKALARRAVRAGVGPAARGVVFTVVMPAAVGVVAGHAAVSLVDHRHAVVPVMLGRVMWTMGAVVSRVMPAMMHRAAPLAVETLLARDAADLADVMGAVLGFLDHERVAVRLLGEGAAGGLVLALVGVVLQALVALVSDMAAVLVLLTALMLFMVLRHRESPPVRPASDRTSR